MPAFRIPVTFHRIGECRSSLRGVAFTFRLSELPASCFYSVDASRVLNLGNFLVSEPFRDSINATIRDLLAETGLEPGQIVEHTHWSDMTWVEPKAEQLRFFSTRLHKSGTMTWDTVLEQALPKHIYHYQTKFPGMALFINQSCLAIGYCSSDQISDFIETELTGKQLQQRLAELRPQPALYY